MAGIKRDKDKNYIHFYKNGVRARSKNKRTDILRVMQAEESNAPNIIYFRALTTEVGKEPGVSTHISKNGKIKLTRMGLSDQALYELHEALDQYIKQILTPKIK